MNEGKISVKGKSRGENSIEIPQSKQFHTEDIIESVQYLQACCTERS